MREDKIMYKAKSGDKQQYMLKLVSTMYDFVLQVFLLFCLDKFVLINVSSDMISTVEMCGRSNFRQVTSTNEARNGQRRTIAIFRPLLS